MDTRSQPPKEPLRDKNIDVARPRGSADDRLRAAGWEIASRPRRGPVLWQRRLGDILAPETFTQADALRQVRDAAKLDKGAT